MSREEEGREQMFFFNGGYRIDRGPKTLAGVEDGSVESNESAELTE
jgi:hypothetical protein